MAQQRQRAQSQHVRRGLVAGEQQQAGDADELVVGEVGAVLTHQHAEDVVAGITPGPLDQRSHVDTSLPLQVQPFGNGHGQVELTRAALLEFVAVVVGHAEKLADRQGRDR